jgi:hypothetical protein
VSKLDSSLVIGRATYERWLGTEPDEIAAAAEALRQLEPEHPSLGERGALPPGTSNQSHARGDSEPGVGERR